MIRKALIKELDVRFFAPRREGNRYVFGSKNLKKKIKRLLGKILKQLNLVGHSECLWLGVLKRGYGKFVLV